MSWGPENMKSSQITVWKDPRGLIDIATGDGHPASLTLNGARQFAVVLRAAAKYAFEVAEAGDVRHEKLADGRVISVGIDTRRRFTGRGTGRPAAGQDANDPPRIPGVFVTIHGDIAFIHASDAAAFSLAVDRAVMRPMKKGI